MKKTPELWAIYSRLMLAGEQWDIAAQILLNTHPQPMVALKRLYEQWEQGYDANLADNKQGD